MKLWKYVIIGIVMRGIMIPLQGVDEYITWCIFGVFIIVIIFLLQRDVRQWLAGRKELKEAEK